MCYLLEIFCYIVYFVFSCICVIFMQSYLPMPVFTDNFLKCDITMGFVNDFVISLYTILILIMFLISFLIYMSYNKLVMCI